MPDRARIWLWRYNGRWSAYLLTSTWAMAPSVGSPPSIRAAGAGACVTPSVQVRQAYLGRTVTITRSCAGTMSSRSVRSSPILCICPQPHGHIRLSGSTICSIRGRLSGRLPRLRLARARLATRRVIGRGPAVLLFLDFGDRRLEIFEGQLPVVFAEFFGLLAMHHMVQLGHQVLEALDDFLEAGRLAVRSLFSRSSAATASRWSSGVAERSIRAAGGMGR